MKRNSNFEQTDVSALSARGGAALRRLAEYLNCGKEGFALRAKKTYFCVWVEVEELPPKKDTNADTAGSLSSRHGGSWIPQKAALMKDFESQQQTCGLSGGVFSSTNFW